MKLVLTMFVAGLLLFLTDPAHAQDWRPLDTSDLSENTSVVEKDADAAALFWEVRLDDADPQVTVLKHYLRVRIFTPRGMESQSRIDLTYRPGQKITNIAARTITPDGTVIDLKRDAIFDRTIVRT